MSPAPGHIVYGGPLHQHRGSGGGGRSAPVGSRACPWSISAKPGQTIDIRIVVLGDGGDPQPTGNGLTTTATTLCSTLFVINDVISGVTEVGVCAAAAGSSSSSSRERHLYASAGNHVMIYVSRDRKLLSTTTTDGAAVEHPRFVLSYEGKARCSENTHAPNIIINCFRF